MHELTDAQVEAAAKALWDDAEHRRGRAHRIDAAYIFEKREWLEADEFDRAEFLTKAEEALTAAFAANTDD